MNIVPSQPVWLFDLDNTLHHADAGIFGLINRYMTDYLAQKLKLSTEEASHVRQDYWHRYGATLAGLQKHHPEIDVYEFLQCSHPLPELLEALVPMENTAATLANLKGRKAVFSNGPSFYVAALIKKMELPNHFEALFGTDNFGMLYKPSDQSYLTVCRLLKARPADCIMIDDSAENLLAAKKLGMTTIWFGSKSHDLPFVDAAISDMVTLNRWASTQGLSIQAA
ncbi:hydrolase [Neisseria sp. 83E34]|nr:pyrimidine 5'-nucleotidase [Neisseria sp. 83E34]KPN72165.1 hydrolase [Neisseria sp. 83E34]